MFRRISKRPFLSGMSRVLDLNSTKNKKDAYPKTDREALNDDWNTIGRDMRKAIQKQKKNALY